MELNNDDKIYLVDANTFYISIFQQHLVNLGYNDISIYNTPDACINELDPPPNMLFYVHSADFSMDLELLKVIKRQVPDIFMIFICGPDNIAPVIQSLKYGAFDYFVKGEGDAKNIEMIVTKIQRVRELLSKHNKMRVIKTSTVNSKGELKFFPNN